MTTYVAFLRGINVGGKSIIKMSALRDSLVSAGFEGVRTYIQSGNVLFVSDIQDKHNLTTSLHNAIYENFELSVDCAVFTKREWQHVIAAAPDWWGVSSDWKHNILILMDGVSVTEAESQIGALQPDIEKLAAGKGVLYQSISWDGFSRSTGGRIAKLPVYKKMTVRNFNTATKLLSLPA